MNCLFTSHHRLCNDVSRHFNMENTVSWICPGRLNHPACQKHKAQPCPACRALFLLLHCPPHLLPAWCLHGCTELGCAGEATAQKTNQFSPRAECRSSGNCTKKKIASTKTGKEKGLIKAAERGWSLEVLFSSVVVYASLNCMWNSRHR